MQNSVSPHKFVLKDINQANKGGLEKYPKSKSFDHPQYCASSKCKFKSTMLFVNILNDRIIESKSKINKE